MAPSHVLKHPRQYSQRPNMLQLITAGPPSWRAYDRYVAKRGVVGRGKRGGFDTGVDRVAVLLSIVPATNNRATGDTATRGQTRSDQERKKINVNENSQWYPTKRHTQTFFFSKSKSFATRVHRPGNMSGFRWSFTVVHRSRVFGQHAPNHQP